MRIMVYNAHVDMAFESIHQNLEQAACGTKGQDDLIYFFDGDDLDEFIDRWFQAPVEKSTPVTTVDMIDCDHLWTTCRQMGGGSVEVCHLCGQVNVPVVCEVISMAEYKRRKKAGY